MLHGARIEVTQVMGLVIASDIVVRTLIDTAVYAIPPSTLALVLPTLCTFAAFLANCGDGEGSSRRIRVPKFCLAGPFLLDGPNSCGSLPWHDYTSPFLLPCSLRVKGEINR